MTNLEVTRKVETRDGEARAQRKMLTGGNRKKKSKIWPRRIGGGGGQDKPPSLTTGWRIPGKKAGPGREHKRASTRGEPESRICVILLNGERRG